MAVPIEGNDTIVVLWRPFPLSRTLQVLQPALSLTPESKLCRHRRSPVDRRSRERSCISGRSGRARSLSRETYRPQRSRDGSPRRAGGSLSSYASVAATSSASHRRSWDGSSAGGAAAPTRPESTTIPTLVVENSR